MDSYRYSPLFGKASGMDEVAKLRTPEVRDIVKRLGAISRDSVVIEGYRAAKPMAIFNPTFVLSRGEELRFFARIVVGYYSYASSIAQLQLDLSEVLEGRLGSREYRGRIVIHPGGRYDMWGAEDPRAYLISGTLHITYTGRTVSYFDERPAMPRTVPLTAVCAENGSCAWRKVYVHLPPRELESRLVSSKDAFMLEESGELLLFHRLHMDDDGFYLLVSQAASSTEDAGEGLQVLRAGPSYEVLRPAPFERKLGWATPPIRVGRGRVLVLIHAVGRELPTYRVLAAELELSREEVAVSAVTRRYIMEPRELYEVYGDRPYVVFPCGAWQVDRDTVLISYGASDTFAAMGLLSLSEVLGELDRGRIY
ncbi:MAG: glycosidase [Thermoproteota archaeon]